MASPITWRTVMGQSLADAARPLAYAGQAMNDGFNIFNKVIADRQQANQDALNRQRDTSLLDAQELLAGAKTAEEVNALSGQINAIRGELDPTRRAKLLGAEDARNQQIDQSFLDRQRASDARTELGTRQLANKFYQDAMNTSPDAIGSLVPAGLENRADFTKLLGDARAGAIATQNFKDGQTRLDHEIANQAHLEKTRPLDLAGKQLANDALEIRNAESLGKFVNGNPMSGEAALKANDRIKGVMSAFNKADSSIGNQYNQEDFFREFDSRFKGMDKEKTIRTQVNEILSNPAYKDVPAKVVLDHVNNIKDNPWYKKDVTLKSSLDDYIKSPQFEIDKGINARRITEARAAADGEISLIRAAANNGVTGPGNLDLLSPALQKRLAGIRNRGSAANGNFYDVVVGHGQFGSPDKPVSQMTMKEAIDFGKDTLIPNTKGNPQLGLPPDKGTSAIGGYQFTQGTLKEFGPKVFGTEWENTKLTGENQEKLAEAIFNSSKNGNMRDRWPNPGVSGSPGAYKNMSWNEFRDVVGPGETGMATPPRPTPSTQVTQKEPAPEPLKANTPSPVSDQQDAKNAEAARKALGKLQGNPEKRATNFEEAKDLLDVAKARLEALQKGSKPGLKDSEEARENFKNKMQEARALVKTAERDFQTFRPENEKAFFGGRVNSPSKKEK